MTEAAARAVSPADGHRGSWLHMIYLQLAAADPARSAAGTGPVGQGPAGRRLIAAMSDISLTFS